MGVASGRTVMTFDITMHQGDPASLGVTVHVSTMWSNNVDRIVISTLTWYPQASR